MPVQVHCSALNIWRCGAVLCGLVLLVPPAVATDAMTGAQAVICSRLGAQTVPLFDPQDREAVSAFYASPRM
jgi:hypothetical protein